MKDKNGREIMEGSIIRQFNGETGFYRGIVTEHEGKLVIETLDDGFVPIEWENAEIIGG